MAGTPFDDMTTVDQRGTLPIPVETRRAVLLDAAGHCKHCGRAAPLELHHRHYETVGREEPEGLVALCRECHHAEHVDRAGTFWVDPRAKEDHWIGYDSMMDQD